LAETTPGSVRISSSARLIGRTLPAMLFNVNLLCGVLMLVETGGQYRGRLIFNQAKNRCFHPPVNEISALRRARRFSRRAQCHFRITTLSISYHFRPAERTSTVPPHSSCRAEYHTVNPHGRNRSCDPTPQGISRNGAVKMGAGVHGASVSAELFRRGREDVQCGKQDWMGVKTITIGR
jgi:hypothetical protein